MMFQRSRPVLIFDTSVVNKFAAFPDFPAVLNGMKEAYFIRIPESVLSELVATKNTELRQRLFSTERRLRSVGEVIHPFHKIIEFSIKAFEHDPHAFDWQRLHVSTPLFEHTLDRLKVHGDEISKAQRNQAAALDKDFKTLFEAMRRPFDEYFARSAKRPTLDDMITSFKREGGSMWIWAQMLFKTDAPAKPSEQMLRTFYDACPPYRALLVALCVSQYERCIRDVSKGEPSMRAGRVDTYMASYLPYCAKFVTDDPRQVELQRQVVVHANLPDTEVVSYSEFMRPLLLTAMPPTETI
jgi:hypothetical protein